MCAANTITFTITNVDLAKRGAIKSALVQLGAREVPAIEATHLVAEQIGQTEKFLTALSGCQYIVNTQWALASLDAGVFLHEQEFELIDENGERNTRACGFCTALLPPIIPLNYPPSKGKWKLVTRALAYAMEVATTMRATVAPTHTHTHARVHTPTHVHMHTRTHTYKHVDRRMLMLIF